MADRPAKQNSFAASHLPQIVGMKWELNSSRNAAKRTFADCTDRVYLRAYGRQSFDVERVDGQIVDQHRDGRIKNSHLRYHAWAYCRGSFSA